MRWVFHHLFRSYDRNLSIIANIRLLSVSGHTFRNKNKIEVFRAGSMYYYYPIQDNTYQTATTFSVLRNSIYQLKVTKISEVGKDIPNGPTPDENNPNYYMTVKVQVNPWILNTKDIELK